MADAPALFWALKATYGRQCLETENGLVFTGEGFLARVRPDGHVSLDVAEGGASGAQGWLLAALAEFLAPDGARRDAGGVVLLVGKHLLRFRGDGRVQAEPLPPADRTEREVLGPIPAHPQRPAVLAESRPAEWGPTAPPAKPWPPAPWPAVGGASASPPAPSEPEASLPGASLEKEITALCERWAPPLPLNGLSAGAREGLRAEMLQARAAIRALLDRVRGGELADRHRRKAALLTLASLDATLRAARDRLAP